MASDREPAGVPDDVPEGVGQTAIGMAWIRAEETRRADRLFDDPYARAFVDEAIDTLPHPDDAALAPFVALAASHGVLRTRFFDDYLLRAAADGYRQVVLLAAGLDSRAYRLAWPVGTRLFELDLPAMLAFKNRVLTAREARPACERVPVPVDLAGDWTNTIVGAGFRPERPTAWLVEGLLAYLTPDEAENLLNTVGELSAPGSRLAFEYIASPHALFEQARSVPGLERFAALWKGGLDEPAPGWLTRHGWGVSTHDRAALAVAHGRPVPETSEGDSFLIASRTGSGEPRLAS